MSIRIANECRLPAHVAIRLLIWTPMPNHHHASFHSALRQAGVDLEVRYYQGVTARRREMGWQDDWQLEPWEEQIPRSLAAIETIPDWKDRIHFIPGIGGGLFGDHFLKNVVRHLCDNRVRWVHWSERDRPGLHGLLRLPKRRWYARLVRKYALGAFGQGFLALRDFARWGIPQEKMALLCYATPAASRENKPDKECMDFQQGRRAFLHLGELRQIKGVDLILRAFAQVATCNRDWVLLLVGKDQSGGQYQALARKLGIDKQVFFRKPVPASNISSVFNTADVLLLPSRFDGWGLPLNEAASVGLALIASDQVGSAYHLIHPGENGFIVRAGSVSSLANTMLAYVRNPLLCEIHGQHSLKVFPEYSPERSAERVVNALTSWMSMK